MQRRVLQARKQLWSLIILIPLSVFAMYAILPTLPSSPMMKESFWASKVTQKQVYDIVICGDSRIYRGLDPKVIKSSLPGNTCFNFGFSSAGLDTVLIQNAVRLLKPNGRKILIIGLSPNSFLGSSLKNEHLKTWLHKDVKSLWIKKYLYPYLNGFGQYAISDLIKYARHEKYYEVFHSESGFAASDRVPADSGSALDAYTKQFEREKWDQNASGEFETSILRLKNQGYTVLLFRVPSTYAMKQLEDKMTDSAADTMLEQLSIHGFKVLKFNNLNLNSYDGSHLDSKSAHILSSVISDELKSK